MVRLTELDLALQLLVLNFTAYKSCKRVAMTKNIEIKIIKSSIPIIWLDTSIVSLMTQWKHKLYKLEDTQADRIAKLYDQIIEHTKSGKLICPLAEQESEIWVERDKWLDTMNKLSLGIVANPLQSIVDDQLAKFMAPYVNNETEIQLSYKDAFYSDPVEELKETLSKPFFITVNPRLIFGAEYQKNIKNVLHEMLNNQREKNVQDRVTFEKQLQMEYLGELQVLFAFQKKLLSGNFTDENDELNTTFGVINLQHQLIMWKSYSGKSHDYKGLIEFYKSQHYQSMPYTNISCNLYAKLMTDKQPIRSGDPMDVKHASTLLPYSDIFITDKAMSAFLKKRKFDELYDTTVCYIGDTDNIDNFFSKLT
jgi:hypothetical protein